MLAILVLLGLETLGNPERQFTQSIVSILGLPAMAIGAWFVSTRLLTYLCGRFDQIPEYLFLLAIGWCMGVAELATFLGLSHEVGAFIAGVTLALCCFSSHSEPDSR